MATVTTDPALTRRPTMVRTGTFTIVRTGTFTIAHAANKGQDSRCWLAAKTRFRERVKDYDNPPKPEQLENFLFSNSNVKNAISECEELKSKADKRYKGKVRKLLEVLSFIKDTGDAVLTCAPETVSIAWGVISSLISIGVKDMESCDQISEASTNIVTIILNCRLYENRQRNSNDAESIELTNRITEAIEELITVILEFCWFASRKFGGENKHKRFGNILGLKSATANEKYEDIVSKYKGLREMKAQSSELAERLKQENEESLKALIFPNLDEISGKLEFIHTDVSAIRSQVGDISQEFNKLNDSEKIRILEQRTNEKFEKLYRDLKPSDAHLRQFGLTLEPLLQRVQTARLSQWLFDNEHYRSWVRGNQKFFYLKGQAGFGKSVTMALAIDQLLHNASRSPLSNFKMRHPRLHSAVYDDAAISPMDKDCPVIFFFFKRGDDGTQLAESAISCLLTQLLHFYSGNTREEKEILMKILEVRHPIKSKAELGFKGDEPKPEDQELSITPNINKLKGIVEAMRRTVYIVIDGIDECTDYESSGLVSELVRLGRPKEGSVKFLFSSREGLDVEKFFAKGEAVIEDNKTTNPNGILCQIHDDATILTVDRSTNEVDMRVYLKDSLTELLGLHPTHHRYFNTAFSPTLEREKTSLNSKQSKEIQSMVETIQKKAEGMFTYSAMVIASLRQPSPLSIKRRIKELPDQMDNLYTKHLESLTMPQKELVLLALKRVAFAPQAMNTLEIVDQFKKRYLDSEESTDPSDSFAADSDDEITEAGEAAGREFFKFSNEKRTIGVIHKSVLDWVEGETSKSQKIFSRQISIAEVFGLDEYGQMKITVPSMYQLPDPTILDLEMDLKIFNRKSLINSITGSLIGPHLAPENFPMEVLASKEFQDRYIPTDYPVENPNSSENPYCRRYSAPLDTAKRERLAATLGTPGHYRGELTHLTFYMRNISELWVYNERKGPKWTKLFLLLRKLSHPRVFIKWSTELLLLNKTIDDLEDPKGLHQLITPGVLAAQLRWGLYLDFLVGDAEFNYDLDFDLRHPSRFGFTILHIPDILLLPESFELIMKKISMRPGGYLYNLEDEDRNTPFLICLLMVRKWHRDGTKQLCLIRTMMAILNYDLEPDLRLNRACNRRFRREFIPGFPPYTNPPLTAALLQTFNLPLISCVLKKYAGEPMFLDLNFPDPWGNNILPFALQMNFPTHELRIEILRLLLEFDIDPNARTWEGVTALEVVTRNLDEDSVKLLLDYGADAYRINTDGITIFMARVDANRSAGPSEQNEFEEKVISKLKLLKHHGADITIQRRGYGGTAIMQVLRKGYLLVADAILQMHKSETEPGDCAYLMKQNLDGETLLHTAANYGRFTALAQARFVIDNINDNLVLQFLGKKNVSSQTALDISLQDSERLELASYLVACYFKYSRMNREETKGEELWLPRHLACRLFWSSYLDSILESMENSDSMRPVYDALTKTRPYSKWLLHPLAGTSHGRLLLEIVEAGAGAAEFEEDEEGWDMFDWAYAYGQDLAILKSSQSMDYESRRLEWEKSEMKIEKWEIEHDSIETIDGLQIKFFEQSCSNENPRVYKIFSFITKYPVSPYANLFYYEITIVQIGQGLYLGFTTDCPNLHDKVGIDVWAKASFGLSSNSGYAYVSGKGEASTSSGNAEIKIGTGDIVGCGYDQESHEIFWTLNGKYLGIYVAGVRLRLWPMISGADLDIDTNFGAKDFVWKGERELSKDKDSDADEV
ncbi:hypothetical protein AOL_s00210g134 [Orbilia oligospora ATCC 24927]|uniref:B30.2/SPRY domain-containing protein n=1 Tax=Arthrobotrys oligospora (strain ATCC 24927 / CBS 115.81 / DSM 1491) TaxID=756982 RepID=G1XRX6_ARTOA|nr:hypothetical protein AOL_s00210g134 [Orbilia oligospora ATCC 24927]EGX43973.1 hypothetical protein AOL_s00210g134 [Orbilia oligospora ATCC 24927]